MLDLNQPLIDLDLDPIIINPVQSDNQVYQGQVEEVQYLLQHAGEVFQLNPLEPQLGLEDPNEHNLIPAAQGSPSTIWGKKSLLFN